MTASPNPLGLAVVTGGAGDIGQAIARRLAATHAGVIVVDRDAAGAEAVAAEIGPRARAAACDVTDPAALAALASESPLGPRLHPRQQRRRGAGPSASAPRRPADWAADRALNLDAAWYCFDAFRPALLAARGSVVNIASVNGLGVFGHPAYSAAKAGMIHLTRLIAVEYGRHGIRANTVAPGTVATRAWEARRAGEPPRDGRKPPPTTPSAASPPPTTWPPPWPSSPAPTPPPSPASACRWTAA